MDLKIGTNIGLVRLEILPKTNVVRAEVDLVDKFKLSYDPLPMDPEDLDQIPLPAQRLNVNLTLNGPVELTLTPPDAQFVTEPKQTLHIKQLMGMEKFETTVEGNGVKLELAFNFAFVKFAVVVKLPSGHRHYFILPDCSKHVDSLMKQIKKRIGLRVIHQILKFESSRMNPHRPLETYLEKSNCEVDLIPILDPKPVNLDIKYEGGGIERVNVNLTDMLDDLSQLLCCLCDHDDPSYFKFENQVMRDLNKTLEEYGIFDKALIEVFFE